MEGMSTGVVGLEAVGRVTDQDYEEVLVPTMRASLEWLTDAEDHDD